MQKDLKSIFGNVTGLDQKSVEFLTRAMTKKNLPGFDYLEFKQSLVALVAMDMDEKTAFKSAFATASTVGLTKEKLLKTAHHYQSVLDLEKKQFDEAHEKRLHQKVASKKTEVEKLKKQILEYQKKIEELQMKVAKATDVIENADEQIQTELTKINDTKENFDFTFQSLKNQIEKDIESINEYL
jgi:chromosome segregation ATPase